jgi:hypothetical protein
MNLKQRRKNWLRGVLARTPEQSKKRRHRNLLKRMASICLRTHRSYAHIGRNDPCYCGNVYAGVLIDDGRGGKMEKPVKFKHCCMHKHVGLSEGEHTPELVRYVNKQTAYFNKHRKVLR